MVSMSLLILSFLWGLIGCASVGLASVVSVHEHTFLNHFAIWFIICAIGAFWIYVSAFIEWLRGRE